MKKSTEIDAFPDQTTDAEHQSNLDDAPNFVSTAKSKNPFLKFAFPSPHRPERSLTSRLASESPVALGKRKETPNDHDVGSTSDLNLPDGTEKITSKKRSSSSRGSKKVKTYEHLRPLSDNLAPGLDTQANSQRKLVTTMGIPEITSGAAFMRLTSRKLDPREDFKLPEQFSIGLTNLVSRPTAEQSELSRKEQIEGVPQLLGKIAQYQPRVVCFVGLGIADIVRSKVVGEKLKADVGLQSYKMVHSQHTNSTSLATDSVGAETLFYAVSSTSGRVVKYQKTDKVQQFKDLRALAEEIKKGAYYTTDLKVISYPIHVEDGL